MDIIEQLLASDLSKLEKPSKDLKIKRLSERLGFDFKVKIEALTPDEYEEIQEHAVDFNKKGEVEKINTDEVQIFTILKGLKSPDLKNKDLQKKFGVPTPKDLVKKMFNPGEIADLYDEIQKLSGFNIDTIEEIKNV